MVKGRVQKVFYRANAKDEATELGLTGWIKNKGPRIVELIIEGPKNVVDEMILWCKEGPRLANVETVQVDYEDHTGEFKDFKIIRE